MLAERKQKMKWSPNPCGNLWAKDTSKFGQKILEKLGWTPGKGLGVNEQGIVNPVRLKCNSTQKGLGYERDTKVVFFKHQEEFSSILSNLNSSTGGSEEQGGPASLEQSSKSCKTRVHYHKFTRGKDLSRYSNKDLSCILGFSTTLNSSISSSDELSHENKQSDQVDDESLQNSELLQTIEHNKSVDEIVQQKKKRKRKYKATEENLISDNTVNCCMSNEVIETCHIEIKAVKQDASNKKKRKQKSYNLTDTNMKTLDNINQIETTEVLNQTDLNSDVLYENATAKKSRKNLVIKSFEEDTKDNSTKSDVSLDKGCDENPDKKAKKNMKKHKKF